MSKAAELCLSSGLKNGVDTNWWYNSVGEDFYEFNENILDKERGAGYWLWKPYIIYDELLRLREGSILIYSDAGIEFINSVHHIIDRMDEDIFFFGNNWNHVDWCKMDVIDAINGKLEQPITVQTRCCHFTYGEPEYAKLKQVQASVILFKVNDKTRRFVKEWLVYCQLPDFIDDTPSKIPNYHTFQEHRHDQAILTCLQIKYGYKLHWWPSTYNNGAFDYEKLPEYSNDNYPIIFHHHRKRDHEWNG